TPARGQGPIEGTNFVDVSTCIVSCGLRNTGELWCADAFYERSALVRVGSLPNGRSDPNSSYSCKVLLLLIPGVDRIARALPASETTRHRYDMGVAHAPEGFRRQHRAGSAAAVQDKRGTCRRDRFLDIALEDALAHV